MNKTSTQSTSWQHYAIIFALLYSPPWKCAPASNCMALLYMGGLIFRITNEGIGRGIPVEMMATLLCTAPVISFPLNKVHIRLVDSEMH